MTIPKIPPLLCGPNTSATEKARERLASFTAPTSTLTLTLRPMDGEDLYKTADAEEFEDGDINGEFDTIVRIDFPPSEEHDGRYNNTIDIQAVVVDVAGNIGFSDSDPSDPTFIHDLGTAYDDRDDKGTKIKHNVLGWFSRHVYRLDDVDPYFKEGQSATGFFVDSDRDESINNSGVMVVFDNDLDASTVGIGTFEVQLDGGTDATVVDAAVDGKKVYLLLEEALAPRLHAWRWSGIRSSRSPTSQVTSRPTDA